MEIKTFTKILKDKSFTNYKKMKYKYGTSFDNFLDNLEAIYYKALPLSDFDGDDLVFIENHARVNQNCIKLLLTDQQQGFGVKAAEEEMHMY